jgi:hypothetical protein
MNHTKTAIAALMAETVNNNHGPAWFRALVAVFQLACSIYLCWYIWRGRDPIERKPNPAPDTKETQK